MALSIVSLYLLYMFGMLIGEHVRISLTECINLNEHTLMPRYTGKPVTGFPRAGKESLTGRESFISSSDRYRVQQCRLHLPVLLYQYV